MKKLTALILSLLLLTLSLPSCGTAEPRDETPEAPVEESSLRVLIDLDIGSNIIEPKLKRALDEYMETDDGWTSFQSNLTALGGPKLKLEFPPIQGEKREMYLTSLRTEIMAGKGPDVFVCAAGPRYVTDLTQLVDGALSSSRVEPVFNFPRGAMKRNMFLCLDEYIPGFKFTQWDRLTPAVMDAGKYKDKQYILPMAYTIPMTVFRKSDFLHTPSRDMTWDDMLQDDPELKAAASLDSSIHLSAALMPLSDPEKDELAFTEEELLDFMTKKIEARQSVLSGDELPPYSNAWLSVGFDGYSLSNEFSPEDELTLVPLYSRSGGCSAAVTSFAAVNANTEYPRAAAFLADYLLGEECQRSSLYAYATLHQAVPVMEGLMQQDAPVSTEVSGGWSLSPENYQTLCALRDSITHAEFSTPLDLELSGLHSDLGDYQKRKSAGTLVHDAYIRMKMMLAES